MLSQFQIELIAPAWPGDLATFWEHVSPVLAYTNKLAIASHPGAHGITGFDRSYNLVRYFRRRSQEDGAPSQRALDFLFHLTCNDVNRMNLHARMDLLAGLSVRRILVVTGDVVGRRHDARPEITTRAHFENSSQLLEAILRDYSNCFESVAVAGYPGAETEPSFTTSLATKIKLGADTIYTQCVESLDAFRGFRSAVNLTHPAVTIIPSVALFRSAESLDKVLRLARIGARSTLRDLRQRLESSNGAEHDAKSFLAGLCRALLAEMPAGSGLVNLCTFGELELAARLISELSSLPGQEPAQNLARLATPCS